jgi:hypothetical protein
MNADGMAVVPSVPPLPRLCPAAGGHGLSITWTLDPAGESSVSRSRQSCNSFDHNILRLEENRAGQAVPHSSSEKPVVRTLAIFITDSISEKGNVLEFAGKRATLGFDSKHQSFGLSTSEPMSLEVDLTGATTADAIPKAIGLLFFHGLKDAVAGVPKELADRIPYDVSSRKGPKQLGQLVYEQESWERLEYGDPRYKPPSVVSAPDPAITEEARRRGYGGTETVFLKLSEAGHASDYWVAWPLDYGLNPQAIAALKGYVFKPATLDG